MWLGLFSQLCAGSAAQSHPWAVGLGVGQLAGCSVVLLLILLNIFSPFT